MARSRLTDIRQNVTSDEGSVLWSIVKGEQLEFPITLEFLSDSTLNPIAHENYRFEAVVVEAANFEEQSSRPTRIKPNGVQTRLFVRQPVFMGVWSQNIVYQKEHIVLFTGKYYKLAQGLAYSSSTPPDIDPNWILTALNIIYLQFPGVLGHNWEIQPSVNHPSYGFFELRVTEPVDLIFTRTFKPVRGMVEILFSPTDVVPDV